MTIAQTEKFYEQDTKSYEIEQNKDFLAWLTTSINNGYHRFIKLKELQEFIDNIANWYEIKYPERELEYFEGIRSMDFPDIKRISNEMDIRQLLFRLPPNQLYLIEGRYEFKGLVQHPIYKNGKNIRSKPIFIRINKKNECNALCGEIPYFLLHINSITGEVSKNYHLEEYLNSEDIEENISFDKLLSIFNEKYADKLDFTQLKEIAYDRNCDMELRYRILQLVALKLLYSRNTIPERGYERAKRFINEFNKNLALTLSTEEIDEAINRDYTNGERCEQVLKNYVDENDQKHSYCTAEDVAKKEQFKEENKGIKKLAKRMFNKNRK